MNTEINITELHEMRQQMSLLKDKLNRQQIVNEQLVRTVVRGKINNLSRMRRSKRFWLVSCIFFVPVLLVQAVGLPVWFAVVTDLFFIFSLFYHEYYMEGIDDCDLSASGLLQVSQKAVRLKRQTRRWLWIGIPLLMLWMATFMYLVNNYTWFLIEENEMAIGLIIGLVVGSLLGYMMYRKQQRMVDDLQGAIEDMQQQ